MAHDTSEPVIAREWHWKEYGAELVGTLLMVLVGLSAVVFDFGTGLPMLRLVPDAGLRRLVTGLLFAGAGSLIAISPLGKLSGAHINPAVSLAFWIRGKMHGHDAILYAISQFTGACAGAVLLAMVWGPYAASIHYGVTAPGADYTPVEAFIAEALMTFTLVEAIFLFVSSRRLMRWTPLMAWLLIATMVWLEAPISGTSLNPARSLGPDLVAHAWRFQWIYFVAPCLGSACAALAFPLVTRGERAILTGKLFHVPHYPCLFKNVIAQCAEPAGPEAAS
ncbi:MAG: MIP/aquaporin family protein [Capsulimonadaceae bacterium]